MLDGAAHLFGTQRFHEVRMEDIATEAKVGKGTLYRYFKDKEELYLALLARASKQLFNRLQVATERVDGARAKLQAVVGALIAFLDEQPHLFDLIQHAEALRGPDFPWQKTRDELLKMVLSLFEEGKSRGEFTIREPDLAVLLFLGGLRAVIRFGKKPRPRNLANKVLDHFLRGNAEFVAARNGVH